MTVGIDVNVKYVSYSGINSSNRPAYFNAANADATYMSRFNASSGTGAGYFEVNVYLVVNSSLTLFVQILEFISCSGTNPYSLVTAQGIKASEFNAIS